ncbi:putative Transmembrane protein [Quillaja saponaria]|uniref:Transmembrane protein n=1 Tax=Quillaja saponaria TaxID=32244 RepID=A0AAD7QC61_QUISA|nr:putative Transmembrane protein [Quillaja saponaria]
MVRTTSSDHYSGSPKQHTKSLLMSITALVALLAKQANRLSGKPKMKSKPNLSRIEPRSPLARPKQLLSNISNKAIQLVHHRKKNCGESETENFGDGGVWQRTILMGDKCEPLDFSGVIYYDCNGKQTNEVPLRSPHASPMPGYLTRGRERVFDNFPAC